MNSLLFHTCSCLVHLSRLEVAVDMYAPDVPQMHVIDHCKGEPAEGETRSEKKIMIKSTDRIYTVLYIGMFWWNQLGLLVAISLPSPPSKLLTTMEWCSQEGLEQQRTCKKNITSNPSY